MNYGNCLTGAIFLLWKERKNSPKFIVKYRVGTKVPHFMVKTKNQLHHFKVDEDLFPWPFCYLLFKGSFQSVSLSEEENYSKANSL